MLPLDNNLVKIIANHLENIYSGLDQGFLTVTLPEAPEGTAEVVKLQIMEAQSDILRHLEVAVSNALLALVQEATAAPEPTLDNLVVVPNIPIEA